MDQSIQTSPKTIRSLFDYKDIFNKLEQEGKKQFGEHFRIYKRDWPILVQIIGWMLHDEDVAAQFNIDLHKGIFLAGPVGVGKTRIMEMAQWLVGRDEYYNLYSCSQISVEFQKSGSEVIELFTSKCFIPHNNLPRTCCFDDLGMEAFSQFYGTPCYVMKQILLGRYELFVKYGMITHVTSNLSAADLEMRYGAEVRSRFREMFNRIVFDKNALDKRGR